jgi:hypothetical protein
MQCQIINRSNPTKAQPREAAAAPVHQSPTCAAERAGHGVASTDRGVGRIGGEVVETADVGQGGGFDSDLLEGGVNVVTSSPSADVQFEVVVFLESIWGFFFSDGDGSITHIRSKHGSRDFAAVGAVADVGVDEVVAFDGLFCRGISHSLLQCSSLLLVSVQR